MRPRTVGGGSQEIGRYDGRPRALLPKDRRMPWTLRENPEYRRTPVDVGAPRQSDTGRLTCH